jgi:dynein heavy chain
MDPSQISLLVNLSMWVKAVEEGFAKYPTDNKSMEKCLDGAKDQLTNLIKLVQGDMEKPLRQKVMCMITMDAHSRDIIQIMVNEGVCESDAF